MVWCLITHQDNFTFLPFTLRYLCGAIDISTSDVCTSTGIRNIYFAYFHAHLKYGLVFLGGDPETKSIFKL
jgi:hypothetical protein